MRLREQGCSPKVCIYLQDSELYRFEQQCNLKQPTNITNEIIGAAMCLLRKHYRWQRPLRSLGIKVTHLIVSCSNVQLNLFTDERLRQKWEQIGKTWTGCADDIELYKKRYIEYIEEREVICKILLYN